MVQIETPGFEPFSFNLTPTTKCKDLLEAVCKHCCIATPSLFQLFAISYGKELYELYPLWVPVTEKPSPQSLIDGFVVHYNSIIPEGFFMKKTPLELPQCRVMLRTHQQLDFQIESKTKEPGDVCMLFNIAVNDVEELRIPLDEKTAIHLAALRMMHQASKGGLQDFNIDFIPTPLRPIHWNSKWRKLCENEIQSIGANHSKKIIELLYLLCVRRLPGYSCRFFPCHLVCDKKRKGGRVGVNSNGVVFWVLGIYHPHSFVEFDSIEKAGLTKDMVLIQAKQISEDGSCFEIKQYIIETPMAPQLYQLLSSFERRNFAKKTATQHEILAETEAPLKEVKNVAPSPHIGRNRHEGAAQINDPGLLTSSASVLPMPQTPNETPNKEVESLSYEQRQSEDSGRMMPLSTADVEKKDVEEKVKVEEAKEEKEDKEEKKDEEDKEEKTGDNVVPIVAVAAVGAVAVGAAVVVAAKLGEDDEESKQEEKIEKVEEEKVEEKEKDKIEEEEEEKN
eukprot:TRINITY_DN145_c0_g5_i1.p1 TRINITY_DN145_c0_g5~~TRINITY_DN145_c0_g5_i1.p1  ORF type:complete len:507 (+),score=131.81 TRINITY_DN145_c0_g5_i1:82-1602(+)